MKYTMVRQFSNAAIDNIYNFLFKWVDFGKMSIEFFWSFFEIWLAFFMIFYNIFMYIYYLFLFFIDRGSESSAGVMKFRGGYSKVSSVPKVNLAPVSRSTSASMGTSMAGAVKSVSSAVAKSIPTTPTRPSAAVSGLKKSVFKNTLSGIMDFIKGIGRLLTKPLTIISELFSKRMERSKDEKDDKTKPKSLIDEYIKEYEQRKR